MNVRVKCFDLLLHGMFFKLELLGRAAVCDCGTPWTFLLPFFFFTPFFNIYTCEIIHKNQNLLKG